MRCKRITDNVFTFFFLVYQKKKEDFEWMLEIY